MLEPVITSERIAMKVERSLQGAPAAGGAAQGAVEGGVVFGGDRVADLIAAIRHDPETVPIPVGQCDAYELGEDLGRALNGPFDEALARGAGTVLLRLVTVHPDAAMEALRIAGAEANQANKLRLRLSENPARVALSLSVLDDLAAVHPEAAKLLAEAKAIIEAKRAQLPNPQELAPALDYRTNFLVVAGMAGRDASFGEHLRKTIEGKA
jgi:hypothetical protein